MSILGSHPLKKHLYEKSIARAGRRVSSFSYHYFFFTKAVKNIYRVEWNAHGAGRSPFMVFFKDGFPYDVLFANTRYVLGKGANNQNGNLRWIFL